MRTSIEGIAIIKHYESCKLKAYQCSAGVWTIGYGHTEGVRPGLVITQQRADMLLENDLRAFERDVLSLVKVKIEQHQFDALVSFAFNVGSDIDADTIPEGLGDSSLLRHLNSGRSDLAAEEFLKWNKVKGVVTKGLIRRRHSERSRFLGNSAAAAIRAGLAAAP